jgi:DNA-binding PadR family transcriptional regulator
MSADVKLTEKQMTVLTLLKLRKPREYSDGPLTGPEIGEQVFRNVRVKHGKSEWAGPALKQLERKGFVEPLGYGPNNARCWTITESGRAALEAGR